MKNIFIMSHLHLAKKNYRFTRNSENYYQLLTICLLFFTIFIFLSNIYLLSSLAIKSLQVILPFLVFLFRNRDQVLYPPMSEYIDTRETIMIIILSIKIAPLYIICLIYVQCSIFLSLFYSKKFIWQRNDISVFILIAWSI